MALLTPNDNTMLNRYDIGAPPVQIVFDYNSINTTITLTLMYLDVVTLLDAASDSSGGDGSHPVAGGGGNGNDGDGSGYKLGDKTPKGRIFTYHGAERANERHFSADSNDSIVDNNRKGRVKQISEYGRVEWRYQDKRGNTVIMDEWEEKIVTVYSHPSDVNNSNYIPK